MGRVIAYDSQGKDITCMKEFTALEYPCEVCDRTNCEERWKYEKAESRKQVQPQTEGYSKSNYS